MENERLKMVSSFIGKPFTESPSPFAHWLRGTIISVSEESLEVEFLIRKEMTNPAGTLHGGVIAGMIDDCMGTNFFVMGLENFHPTINLNIEYFNPAKEGEIVLVRTKVVRRGRTLINMKADMFGKRERHLASATSNLIATNIKIPF